MYVVICNCPTEDAVRIARTLVQSQAAACVNIGTPVTSVYRWNGAIEEATETPIICKTSSRGLTRLRDMLLSLHPYDVPEIVALKADAAGTLKAYADWVEEET